MSYEQDPLFEGYDKNKYDYLHNDAESYWRNGSWQMEANCVCTFCRMSRLWLRATNSGMTLDSEMSKEDVETTLALFEAFPR